MNEIKFIDLCCGLGGFRVALNNINNYKFKCVLSADIKSDALKAYNLNFEENNKKQDIYELKPDKVPDHALLCAGFPCQPFSSAGNKKGFDDKRGGMIFNIVDIAREKKPSVIVLENVYNLLTLDNGNCIKQII